MFRLMLKKKSVKHNFIWGNGCAGAVYFPLRFVGYFVDDSPYCGDTFIGFCFF